MRKTSYVLFALSLMGLVSAFISAGISMSVPFVVLPRLACSIYLMATAYWVFRESRLGYRLGVGALVLIAVTMMTSPLWALSRIDEFGVEGFALGSVGLIASGAWALHRGLRQWNQIYQGRLGVQGGEKEVISHKT